MLIMQLKISYLLALCMAEDIKIDVNLNSNAQSPDSFKG
jgi:hypothetical protein